MGAWVLETLGCMVAAVAAVVALCWLGQALPRLVRGKR